jgi:hypothetical protein
MVRTGKDDWINSHGPLLGRSEDLFLKRGIVSHCTKLIVSSLLSTAALFSSTVQSMPIQQFDKMTSEDKGEYVGLLVGGAEHVLKDKGRAGLAAQVKVMSNPTSLVRRFYASCASPVRGCSAMIKGYDAAA